MNFIHVRGNTNSIFLNSLGLDAHARVSDCGLVLVIHE